MAPEVILRRPYDQKVDAYALGIVLYEMLSYQKPFYSKNSLKMKKKILADEISFRPKVFKHVSADAKDLICQLT